MPFVVRTLRVWERRLLIALVVMVGWLAGFHLWAGYTFALPLDEPISLSPAGSIDRTILVRVGASHTLNLSLAFGTRPRADAKRIVGSYEEQRRGGGSSSVGIPLRWSLSDMAGSVVKTGETEAHGSYAEGESRLRRFVASAGELAPGRYRLSATVLRDVPDFEGMPARLQLHLPRPGFSFGWESDLAFYGGYVTYLVLVPLVFIVLVALMVEAAVSAGRRDQRT